MNERQSARLFASWAKAETLADKLDVSAFDGVIQWDGPEIKLGVFRVSWGHTAQAVCEWRGQLIRSRVPFELGRVASRHDESARIIQPLLNQVAQHAKDQVRMRELGVFMVAPAKDCPR